MKKIEAHFGSSLKGKTIAVWGPAFKPKTDDMREAPAIPIIEMLLAKGAVQAYDPEAMKIAKTLFGNKIRYAAKNYDALKGADALAVVTEWQEFREPDFARIKKLMRSPVVFDGRNIYQPDQRRRWGSPISPLTLGAFGWSSRVAPATSAATPCALADAGHAVAVLDDLSAGHADAVPKGVPLVVASIHDRDAAWKLLVDHRADAMHFAAWLNVGESVQKLVEYYDNNVVGTLAVLAAMRDAGVPRFILSSTCAVYGEPASVPIVETLDKNPINAYGESKLTVERALPHLERARTASGGWRCVFQRRGSVAGRIDRRGSRARNPSHPAGDPRRDRRPAAQGVRRGLSDARRHLPARLHPSSATWPRRTSGPSRRLTVARPPAPSTSAPARRTR